MQAKKFIPSHARRAADSAKSRHMTVVRYTQIKEANKPVYKSSFRPTSERMEEIIKKGEELPDAPVTEGKVFRKW